MSHKLVYNQTPEEFSSETYESKALLEDIIGARVLGYRASTYSITRRSLWALDILHEAGFEYDSSIFPIRHDTYGIPDAPQVPSRIATPKGASIVGFRCRPRRCSARIGFRRRLFPAAALLADTFGLAKLNGELNRPFIFYLHPGKWTRQPRAHQLEIRLRRLHQPGSLRSAIAQLMGEFHSAACATC
jgi:peptidoglycan/xylan/chitin deacetylase (PgdA/CDA1 family)